MLPVYNVDVTDNLLPGMVPPFLSYPAWDGAAAMLPSLRYLTWQGGDHATYECPSIRPNPI